MHFIVNLLILLPAQIASYFSWAGPLIMRLIAGYTHYQRKEGAAVDPPGSTPPVPGWK